MKLIETDALNASQKESVHALWNNEYPQRLQHACLEELDRYLAALSRQQHLLLCEENGNVAAWCFSFDRDGACWFAIIVRRDQQGLGRGRTLLGELKKRQHELNGWVVDHETEKKDDGTAYVSPLPFYLANGFKTVPETRLETDKLSAVKIVWKS